MNDHARQTVFYTKTEHLVQLIKESILAGDVLPGQQLVQREIAQRYNSSVTPVREALNQLSSEGIVVYEPHYGARVQPIDVEGVDEICLIRSALEELGLELAFPRITPDDLQELRDIQAAIEERIGDRQWYSDYRKLNHEFHFGLFQSGECRHLQSTLEHVWYRLPWQTMPVTYEGVLDVAREHTAVIDALENQDLQRAKQALRKHILEWGEAVRLYLLGVAQVERT